MKYQAIKMHCHGFCADAIGDRTDVLDLCMPSWLGDCCGELRDNLEAALSDLRTMRVADQPAWFGNEGRLYRANMYFIRELSDIEEESERWTTRPPG